MKHFLFEFITGGGLTGQTLPNSLVREGRIMVKIILEELIACGHTEITVIKDERIESFSKNVFEHTIKTSLDVKLPEFIKNSEFCWLIAHETGKCLYNLTNLN